LRNFYLRGALIDLAEVLVVKNGKNELLILVQVLINHPPQPPTPNKQIEAPFQSNQKPREYVQQQQQTAKESTTVRTTESTTKHKT
jgi:hypothetical protein